MYLYNGCTVGVYLAPPPLSQGKTAYDLAVENHNTYAMDTITMGRSKRSPALLWEMVTRQPVRGRERGRGRGMVESCVMLCHHFQFPCAPDLHSLIICHLCSETALRLEDTDPTACTCTCTCIHVHVYMPYLHGDSAHVHVHKGLFECA